MTDTSLLYSGSRGRGAVSARRRWLTALVAAFGLAALGLSGCSPDDGSDGAPGAASTVPGPPGTDGSPGSLGDLRPSVHVTNVEINEDNHPVVEFEVEAVTPFGRVYDFMEAADFEFLFARLVDKDGYLTWQSYIAEAANTNLPYRGDHANLQAGGERGQQGDLESLGAGAYRYTMTVDVTDTPQGYVDEAPPVSESDWATYDSSDTHRMVVLLRPGDHWKPAHGYDDFRPDGNPLADTKRATATASCSNCHDSLTMHGGNRVGNETCTTCHNQYTYHSDDADAEHPVDLAYIGHEIHSGGHGGDTVTGAQNYLQTDWTEIGFPRRILNCSSCHNEDDGADDRWYTAPSVQACLSCHDEGNWAGWTGAHSGDPAVSDCASCHGDGDNNAADVVHVDDTYEDTLKTAYHIESVEVDGTNLTVQWQLLYDGEPQQSGVDGWDFDPTLRVGWAEGYADYTHSEDGADGRPGAPLGLSGIEDASDFDGGTYTYTVDLDTEANNLPNDAYLVVSLERSVGKDGDSLVARNAVGYGVIGNPDFDERREVVAMDNCLSCHESQDGAFVAHGPTNARNQVETCIICHNSNSTDIDYREFFDQHDATHQDGQEEQATNLMVMMHAFHGADDREEPIYIGTRPGSVGNDQTAESTSEFSTASYPTSSANCTQCHVGETYYGAMEEDGLRGTTGRTDSAAAGPNRDALGMHEKAAANIAACVSCHDDRTAREHMAQNDGSTQVDTGSPLGVTLFTQGDLDGQWPTCRTCHGPDRTADVKKVHGLD